MANAVFRPNYLVHPGAVLAEYLDVAGMSQAELAARCDRPTKTISEIIHGKASITPETAIQLERVLGASAVLWNNLQANHDLRKAALEQDAALTKKAAWAKQFPLAAMRKLGWIERTGTGAQEVESLLRYFGVASPDAYDKRWRDVPVAFRRSSRFAADPAALQAWLRRGEQVATSVEAAPFDAHRVRSVVKSVAAWTVLPFEQGLRAAQEAFANAGVALVVVPSVPKTSVSGAARWLSKDRALIQLSLRFKTADHAWFTLLHEVGHIVLHGKREMFVDDSNSASGSVQQEREADAFASDALISADALAAFVAGGRFDARSVAEFAAEVGVGVGIVVGRLHHDGWVGHRELRGMREAVDPVLAATSI